MFMPNDIYDFAGETIKPDVAARYMNFLYSTIAFLVKFAVQEFSALIRAEKP